MQLTRQHVDARAPNAENIDLRLGDRSGEGEQFGEAIQLGWFLQLKIT
jgi:hypothetical protein